jgi:alpha-mannosidase
VANLTNPLPVAAAILALIGAPSLLAQRRGPALPPRPPERYQAALTRLNAMTATNITSWRAHAADIPHGEDPTLDDSQWTAITLAGGGRGNGGGGGGGAQAPGNGHTWYRTVIEIPPTVGGKDIRGARVRLMVRLSNDARIFFNGALAAQGDGRTLDPILITDKAAPGQKVLVAVNTPYHAESGRLTGAQLMVDYPGQPDPGVLRTDIQSAEEVINGFPNGKDDHERQLDAAVKAIDFAALDRGDQAAFTHSLEAATRGLDPLRDWMRQYTVKIVGNAHIDMAWLWPWTETVEVVRDTFGTALQLMREYPDFTYAQSSVQDYAWLRDKYPAEFQQIQQRVKEGRWELVGGMWVEPDLNMPDGESLVRQLLVGTRFFQKEFGKSTDVGWNPDTFGYNWQLPQIYKRSGFDSFVTQKMSWNETNLFPYKLFWWQAPDGSKVLTYFPHGYGSGINPVALSQDVADYVPADHFPEIMHLYGVGDHGGGPTRQMLDEAVRLEQPSAIFPKLEFGTARGFFDDMEKKINSGDLKPPTWADELYLEYHRGCYTTQSETKKQIRRNEEQLQNAEKFASLDYLDTHAYPNGRFEDIWKKVLFDMFHDIMPGSGIAVNYVDALENLNNANLESGKILNGALGDLASRVDTQGAGEAIVVFNPLSWERTGPVTVEVHTPPAGQQLQVRDSAGQSLLAQVIASDPATERTTLEVMVKSVPPVGYETIHVVSAAAPRAAATSLKINGTDIENEFFRVKIDQQTGCVTSLVNKADNKESVAPGGCGNLLQTFVDRPPQQDAWEIKFDEQSWDLKQPEEVKLVENGPERAVVRIKNKFQNSTFSRDVVIRVGSPRIDVDTTVDWHENHILLKVGFPVNAQSDNATFEIPYGTIQRPTTRNNSLEKAKFEVPALRWGDISNASQGFSLLNASKYGYDAKGNVIRISLLRSPNMPAPDNHVADQGLHQMTYALYAHSGDWRAGNTMRQGYELNYPLIALIAQPHAGALPAKHAFARIEPGNVILTVMKKAEDEDGLIFRFYEFEGKPAQVKLELPQKAVSAVETNLMEKHQGAVKLAADARSLSLQTGPYEIRTVEVSFAPGK